MATMVTETDAQAFAIQASDVAAAAERLSGVAVRTPLLESAALNDAAGGRLLVKPEMLQVTGSFKFRGAFNKVVQLSAGDRARGVVAYSSGNHAQGVAAAAMRLGTPAVIVMPDDAPAVKRAGTARWGAEVITYDRQAGEDRVAITEEIAATRGMTLIRPYDDPDIMAGQGTVGQEIVAQAAEHGAVIDQVLVPCGGGGLTSGVATAVRAALPGVSIYAVEPAGFDDTMRSLASGQRESNDGPETGLCDSLLAPQPGRLTFPVVQKLCAGGLVVSDDEVRAAMRAAFAHLKLVAEPGGAAALAAALSGKTDLAGRTTVVVMSGGNVDPQLYARIIADGG